MRRRASSASATGRPSRATATTWSTVRSRPVSSTEGDSWRSVRGMAAPILRSVRRVPDPTSRLVVSDDAQDLLGGAVPSPAVAFLLTLIAFFFFQAEDGIRDLTVTGVQTCALPI